MSEILGARVMRLPQGPLSGSVQGRLLAKSWTECLMSRRAHPITNRLYWRPQGDSNPCSRCERVAKPVLWTVVDRDTPLITREIQVFRPCASVLVGLRLCGKFVGSHMEGDGGADSSEPEARHPVRPGEAAGKRNLPTRCPWRLGARLAIGRDRRVGCGSPRSFATACVARLRSARPMMFSIPMASSRSAIHKRKRRHANGSRQSLGPQRTRARTPFARPLPIISIGSAPPAVSRSKRLRRASTPLSCRDWATRKWRR